MCVGTLTEKEVNKVPTDLGKYQEVKKEQPKKSNIFKKAKEKHIKLHDEMIPREGKHKSDCEQNENNSTFVTDDGFNFTVKFRTFCNKCFSCYIAWKHTKFYRIISSIQLAHVIMTLAVLCVASSLFPNNERIYSTGQPHSKFFSFIYLMSFVVHLGSQIWMTFVSGLSLYFALPRHTFSQVQRVLFPTYFTVNAILSLINLLIFVKYHPVHTWDLELTIQVIGMTSTFFLELIIRLYLTPPLMRLIVQKNTFELSANVGKEIGYQNFGVLKHCPHYLKIHHTFRQVHTSIAIGNLCAMACTFLHLHYISSKLCML